MKTNSNIQFQSVGINTSDSEQKRCLKSRGNGRGCKIGTHLRGIGLKQIFKILQELTVEKGGQRAEHISITTPCKRVLPFQNIDDTSIMILQYNQGFQNKHFQLLSCLLL